MGITFILGCARSGTTSLTRALDLSRHAHCLVEPMPNLNLESREMFEGRIHDPHQTLRTGLGPRIEEGLAQSPHYIEKQLSLVPFMRHLVEMFNSRIVIPYRDGRDVVTSLINWHNQMFPIIYQECRDTPPLGPHAREVLDRQTAPDPYDYSLPRPPINDPWSGSWAGFSRFEMVSWYWAYVHRFIHEQLEHIDPSKYLFVDYSDPTPATIESVYEFIGLEDFDAHAVQLMLDLRINSLQDRIGETGAFPNWSDWTADQVQRFNELAWDAMQLMGFAQDSIRPKAPDMAAGPFGLGGDGLPAAALGDPDTPERDQLESWMSSVEARTGEFDHCIQIGAGVADQAAPKADLVLSWRTIDHVHDIDAFLRSLARMTNRFLYVKNDGGYAGAMARHRYLWDHESSVFRNAVSPARIDEVLREEGFQTILIFPQSTLHKDARIETVVIASREEVDPRILMAHHTIALDVEPYVARSSNLTREEIDQSINLGCAYFSDDQLDLANPLSLIDRVLGDLRAHDHRRPGTMEELAGDGGVNVAIRVDVDMDLVAAVEMARIARAHDWPLSFYILHTAAYYGMFRDGDFLRNQCNADTYLQLQAAGCEVGLHIDPYHCYLQHGVDGAGAVREELRWLREIGLNIRGISGHNCAPVYGAESFEIFDEWRIAPGAFFDRHHVYLPLGVLHATQLGLTYEAGAARPASPEAPTNHKYLRGLPEGDFLRCPTWFREYLLDNPYCHWGYDYNIWILGRDRWAVAGRPEGAAPVFLFDVPWEQVNQFVAALGPDEKVAITLHPIYFGRRSGPGVAPDPCE